MKEKDNLRILTKYKHDGEKFVFSKKRER